MLKVTVDPVRPYDATTNVTRTIAWNTEAEGYDPTIHTDDNLNALRLRATITLADPNAGDNKEVLFSDFTYAESGSNLTVDGNFAAAAAAHFTSQTVTVTPVDITVVFAFKDGVYGDAAPEFDRNRTTYDVATPFEAWEDQRGYFNLNVDDATVIYSDASGKEYRYVQYDADGNVRLHDVHYEKVRITANAEFVNLKNYTLGGVALDSADATDGFSGTLEAAAVLTPKPLEYDTSGLAGATKVYDGTS